MSTLTFIDHNGKLAYMEADEREAIERSGKSNWEAYAHGDPPEVIEHFPFIQLAKGRPGKTEGGGIQEDCFAKPWENDPTYVRALIAYHRSTRDGKDAIDMLRSSIFLKNARKAARKRHKKLPRSIDDILEKKSEFIKPLRWTTEERKRLRQYKADIPSGKSGKVDRNDRTGFWTNGDRQ